jgi:hypothetical protein
LFRIGTDVVADVVRVGPLMSCVTAVGGVRAFGMALASSVMTIRGVEPELKRYEL